MLIFKDKMIVRMFRTDMKWGIRMYRGLWDFINRHMDRSHVVSVFLPVMIIGWTLAGVLAGIVVCSLMGADLMGALAEIICAGGYAGIIFGLFGGVFFLYGVDM